MTKPLHFREEGKPTNSAASTMSTGEREKKAKRPRRENPAEPEQVWPATRSSASSSSSPREQEVECRDINVAQHRSTALWMPNPDALSPLLQASTSVSDLALLNASITRSILMREQEMASRLQLSLLSRATSEGLALQMLRTQLRAHETTSMLQPQLWQQHSLLSQLHGGQAPRGPPSALLTNASLQHPSMLSLPSGLLPIVPGVHHLGSTAVQPSQDLLTSALTRVAREEPRRSPGGGRPRPASGAAPHPNGCLYHPRAFPVSVESDRECTSKYQAFLRQQLLYFETVPLDTQASAKGRNKPIKVGQVGIMCIHCRNVPPPKRPRGSVYYPQKLVGVYQSAQNMAKNHFAGPGCANAPADVTGELQGLRAEQTSFYGGGQPYWAKCAALAGIVETDDGLEFAPAMPPPAMGGGSAGMPKLGT